MKEMSVDQEDECEEMSIDKWDKFQKLFRKVREKSYVF